MSRRGPLRAAGRARATALAAAAFASLAGAPALADSPGLSLSLSVSRTGWVGVQVTRPGGVPVSVAELVDGVAQPPAVSIPAGAELSATVAKALPWRCDRRDRTFVASTTSAGSTAVTAPVTIRTPSCRNRLAVRLRPRRPRARRPEVVQLVDRWRVGDVEARACLRAPWQRRARCRAARIPANRDRTAVRFRPKRAGRWQVEIRFRYAPTRRRTLRVAPQSRRLLVLATGDSMIQILDGYLRRRLGALGPISVRSDAHISTGISRPFGLNWQVHARATAHGLRPDVTVAFLGANDGYPMKTPAGKTAPCCGEAWVREYARRAHRMMASYARQGAGSVYWLLLPVPRGRNFQMVFRPVNAALRRAARDFPGVVHLVDLGRTFTPGGRFRQYIRWHGRRVNARQGDGVHLSAAGASIAATLVMRAMRRDGVIG